MLSFWPRLKAFFYDPVVLGLRLESDRGRTPVVRRTSGLHPKRWNLHAAQPCAVCIDQISQLSDGLSYDLGATTGVMFSSGTLTSIVGTPTAAINGSGLPSKYWLKTSNCDRRFVTPVDGLVLKSVITYSA